MSSAPLQGMRVLDLSQQLPGPYATVLLASLGASVTKVEPPAGDAARHLDPEMFANVNAGKSSITLDLKQHLARESLYGMVADTDVFIEGFRPGVTARLGCDYETIRAIRPNIVYCSISGFGQTGPLASHPTHDLSLQAMVGALPEDAEISRIGVPWVDLATGTTAALAITAAWHAGSGIYLDMSMLDSAVAWSAVKPAAVHDVEPTYGTFATADGEKVVVALLEDAMWQRMCIALGWHDWAEDSDYLHYLDRRRLAFQIRERLVPALRLLTYSGVLDLARDYDIPIGPVQDLANLDSREQITSRFPEELPAWRSCVPLPHVLMQPLGNAPELTSS